LAKIEMSKVFISWYDGQNHSAANEFFGLLKRHGFDVHHSPYSPHSDIHDERWPNWHKDGLPKAIARAEIFIAVITPACDGSTWMLEEFETAYSSFLKNGKPALYFIRFDSVERPVHYPEHYLSKAVRLSSSSLDAVQMLLSSGE
jgi:hypothetical protein